MKTFQKSLNNQDGFILALSMAMLVVLTLIGLSATRSSVTDIKIAGNERKMIQEFYTADSSWQIGALWLNRQGAVPDIVNRTKIGADTDSDFETKEPYKIIRNYGKGGNGVTNTSFGAGTQDGTFLSVDFWYRLLVYDSKKAEGSGEGYNDYPIDIDSTASGRTTISTRIFKILKQGY